ncbi:MAG: FadR family transcriptional regulator [Gammaproteobacteria bacterium]|nr:FadR family transcriptional regulator [Gammaproteobacteria bacterium]MDH3858629.1 FadR family transcriptional regulator [Gammaproteobacteria bacterium]
MQENAIVKASISKQIAEQLRAAIVAGQFKIGQRLPTEDELAQRYGVSRPSVREALKRLAAQNLVRARRGPTGGNFVVQPSYAELAESLSGAATLLVGMGALGIEEIIEARRALQGSCLELAAVNANESHIQNIEAALIRQQDPGISDEAFCQADVAFHRALVDATENGMLRFVMYTVIEALIPVTNMVVTVVRERSDIVSLHQQMLEHLEQGNVNAMKARMDELLDYLLKKFEQASASRG